jgi:hypothetical protein
MLIARWGGRLRNGCRSSPQRAIVELRKALQRLDVTEPEFMGQQWVRLELLLDSIGFAAKYCPFYSRREISA